MELSDGTVLEVTPGPSYGFSHLPLTLYMPGILLPSVRDAIELSSPDNLTSAVRESGLCTRGCWVA